MEGACRTVFALSLENLYRCVIFWNKEAVCISFKKVMK